MAKTFQITDNIHTLTLLWLDFPLSDGMTPVLAVLEEDLLDKKPVVKFTTTDADHGVLFITQQVLFGSSLKKAFDNAIDVTHEVFPSLPPVPADATQKIDVKGMSL